MRKRIFIALFTLLSISSYAQQQVTSKLSLQPTLPVAGKELDISYDASGSDLEFSDEVKAALVLFQNFDWIAQSLPLSKRNGKWTAKYLLPQNVTFIAVKFYRGDIERPDVVDNNEGKGFYTAVLSSKGKLVAGSYLAEAILLTPPVPGGLLDGFSAPKENISNTEALLEKEGQIKGSGIEKYMSAYLMLKKKIMSETAFRKYADGILKDQLKSINISEQLLGDIQRYYSFDLKDKAMAQKVANRIKELYPNGSAARFLAFEEVMALKDLKKHQDAALQFLKDFPLTVWRKNPDSRAFAYYTIYRGIAEYYFDNHEYDKYLSLFDIIDFKTANELYRWNILRGFLSNKVDKKILFDMSSKLIPYLLAHQKDNSYMDDFQDSLKAQQNADQQMDDRLYTHIALAKETGSYAEGRNYLKKLTSDGLYSNAEINEIHLFILEKLVDEKGILTLLEMSVKNSAVTPSMFDKLKSIYLKNHNGNEVGYQNYLNSLKSKSKNDAMANHVRENMVDHPLIPFTLEDANGNIVNSADWKDKIVVIDFWATWCRPCIMAFPGMQLLVDKYAKDQQVVIYLVGTMQTGDYKAKSVNYVKSNGFRFNMLHDAVDKNGEQEKVFKSLVPLFNSSAIPRKIILKNGRVRYSSEGYSGSPSQLMDELSMAIEMLRSEK
ncbi:TlpA disulfide reductase family protein [Pedobacter sp. MC2016-24]|uniref:TlpA family protein disulfide reductase n=1 Tax=Pedobacter sp. MC2016-24 TaxID=2780090 RepID=UPI00187E3100|nr:TlpA disulfide reductase family protein [Pedobacter sp. MC2016-24]MBE9601567.1 TlpA family protein disulfide reductase [Pedobacter sp. MC2016-24]